MKTRYNHMEVLYLVGTECRKTYLGTQIVDPFDRRLDVTTVYSVPDVYSCLY